MLMSLADLVDMITQICGRTELAEADWKVIEEVEKGDLVLTYNLETRPMTYESVLWTHHYGIVDETSIVFTAHK
jgi:predicted Mrr-cat superfamily restriction endonuclease